MYFNNNKSLGLETVLSKIAYPATWQRARLELPKVVFSSATEVPPSIIYEVNEKMKL